MVLRKAKKVIYYLARKLKEKDFLLSMVEDNKQYLVNGKYRVTWTGKRKIYLKNANTKKFLLKNKYQSNDASLFSVKSLVDAISTAFFTIAVTNGKEGAVKGELIMMTYSNNVKIIDFTQKIILNKMAADPLTYKRIKQGFQSLHSHFKMTITEFSDQEYMYVEKYLEFTPYHRWGVGNIEMCIDEIFSSYLRYFTSFNSEAIARQNPSAMLEELKSTAYRNHELVSKLEAWLSKSTSVRDYPVVRGHGDMKFENILLTNKEFYFIDLEFSADYIFYYDLINLIFNEVLNGDYSYADFYLQGKYDEKYKKLFEVFDLNFDEDKKLYYLAVYLLNRIVSYDLAVTVHRLDLADMFDKYLQTLSKIEQLDERCPNL